MGDLLQVSGILIILSSVGSILFGAYGFVLFPIIFALGCIVLGLSKIIYQLESKQIHNFEYPPK
jgi:hypothetical protein